MLEERDVANCVSSIITQYYYFIIVMWGKGKIGGKRKRVQAIIRANRMMMEREVAPSAKPESL